MKPLAASRSIRINTGIWDEPWFAELPPEFKSAWFYILTHRSRAGYWQWSRHELSDHCGVNLSDPGVFGRFRDAFSGLIESHSSNHCVRITSQTRMPETVKSEPTQLILGQNPRTKAKPPVQKETYLMLQDLYNEICYMGAGMKESFILTDLRKKRMKVFWTKVCECDPTRAREFFETVARSDLLNGTSVSWTADLSWILDKENMARIMEGYYDNKTASKR